VTANVTRITTIEKVRWEVLLVESVTVNVVWNVPG
jgi:hypothetical protein